MSQALTCLLIRPVDTLTHPGLLLLDLPHLAADHGPARVIVRPLLLRAEEDGLVGGHRLCATLVAADPWQVPWKGRVVTARHADDCLLVDAERLGHFLGLVLQGPLYQVSHV